MKHLGSRRKGLFFPGRDSDKGSGPLAAGTTAGVSTRAPSTHEVPVVELNDDSVFTIPRRSSLGQGGASGSK